MKNSIGYRIKKRREELEMSQEELALRLGYKSRSSIAKIEKDGRELPQKKIAAIAEALKTTPSYIMGWQEVQEKNSTLVDLTIRMRTDSDFYAIVEGLNKLDTVQLASVKQVVDAFLSTKG